MTRKPFAFIAGALALSACLVAADIASAASNRRSIKRTSNQTTVDLGNGVFVYSTNPGSITSFSWNGGNSTGSWSGAAPR